MRILLAEDDAGLLRQLATALLAVGHEVAETAEGHETLAQLTSGDWEVAVLDINMPGIDGVEVIRRARAAGCQTPIVLSTARGEVSDKVAGLDAGADDYLVKPYSIEELLARLRVLERRQKPAMGHVIRVADLEIDLLSRHVARAGVPIGLTNREFSLLETLAHATPRPVSRVDLAGRVWDHYFDPSSNVINVYVNYLRKKIDQPGMVPLIHTVRGIGFALAAEVIS